MRAMGLLLLLAVGGTVDARATRLVNLDKEEDGLDRLAEAAGACDAAQPAFIKQWCEKKPLANVRFARKLAVKVTADGDTLMKVPLTVTDHGKGFISSVVPPPIYCDAQSCVFPETMTVFARTQAPIGDATKIASVTITFEVDGMWKVRQWWGPKATKIEVSFADRAGKQLGEGTLLSREP